MTLRLLHALVPLGTLYERLPNGRAFLIGAAPRQKRRGPNHDSTCAPFHLRLGEIRCLPWPFLAQAFFPLAENAPPLFPRGFPAVPLHKGHDQRFWRSKKKKKKIFLTNKNTEEPPQQIPLLRWAPSRACLPSLPATPIAAAPWSCSRLGRYAVMGVPRVQAKFFVLLAAGYTVTPAPDQPLATRNQRRHVGHPSALPESGDVHRLGPATGPSARPGHRPLYGRRVILVSAKST